MRLKIEFDSSKDDRPLDRILSAIAKKDYNVYYMKYCGDNVIDVGIVPGNIPTDNMIQILKNLQAVNKLELI